MYITLTMMVLCSLPSEGPDTVVVCPEQFRAALEPWLAYRAQQGHRIALLSDTQSAEGIRASIRQVAKAGNLRYVVLVGDASPNPGDSTGQSQVCVPTHLEKAKVNLRWGSEPEIATDNGYADLDEDGLPDLAVGRLTADTSQQLTRIVNKILAYERQAAHGQWRRRINLVAGVGGFGKLVDSLLEMATKTFLISCIPSSYDITMTYGSWRSPYCPDPRDFHRATVDRFNEGCLFWVYMGHGQRHFLDHVTVPGGRFHILDVDDVGKLRPVQGWPIAVFLACYTGAFDESRDCLAEEMLRATDGPVAVFCGSRVTMPYAMSVMCHELMDEYFQIRCATLGLLLLNTKRRMAAKPEKTENAAELTNRQILDTLAQLVSPSAELLDQERAEHVLLFNLLGDPLMRLHYPQTVELTTANTVDAGETLSVMCRSALSGRCTVELVCRRDRTTFTPPRRAYFDGSDLALAAYNDVYCRANDARWTTRSFAVEAGEFQTELPVPDRASGACHVRVFIDAVDDCAIGAADVVVRRPGEAQPSDAVGE